MNTHENKKEITEKEVENTRSSCTNQKCSPCIVTKLAFLAVIIMGLMQLWEQMS